MYEAMKIRAGTKAKHGNLDDSGVQILQNSCGLSIAVGTIKFFCKNPAESPNGVGTEDLEAAGWHDWMFYSGECSNTTAGTYISKDGKTFTPAFWGQQPVERSAWRMAGASWNCCSGDPNFVADFQGWEPRSRLAGGEKS
jgi:hypothetical protein